MIDTKTEILALLETCLPQYDENEPKSLISGREGMQDLITFLKKTDFFTAPASIKHHDNSEGGLAAHSLKVWRILKDKVAYFKLNIPEDSVIITGLLHDVCKIGYYQKKADPKASVKQIQYLKDLIAKNPDVDIKSFPDSATITLSQASVCIDHLVNNSPLEFKPPYEVKDSFPLGHGEKSLHIISRFIKLTKEEACMIRWHMGRFEPGTSFNYLGGDAFDAATNMFPTVILMHTSDYEASNFGL